MHAQLESTKDHLKGIIKALTTKIPNDTSFGIAQGNWSFPGLTRQDLIDEAQEIIDFIDDHEADELEDDDIDSLDEFDKRLVFVRDQTIPNIWGNANAGVTAYSLTLQGLRRLLASILKTDSRAETMKTLRTLTRSVRAMEATLNGLEPRTASLSTLVERIEHAYNAADQLPTDLEALSEARQKIANLISEATKDEGHIADIRKKADDYDKKLLGSLEEAKQVIENCESAYSAATSVGLAAAFTERSKALSDSMWVWVVGLIAALGIGGYFGSNQLNHLAELMSTPNASTGLVVLNLLLSVMSVGAPIWFGWLATKQIGHQFRLAEDYAFKASVSRAYEGFRRETARFDKDMEARLLSSALTRLDELPLRLVAQDNHGSPWHELASSDVVKQAMNLVPGFTSQVKDIADKAINALAASKAKSPPPAPKSKKDDEEEE